MFSALLTLLVIIGFGLSIFLIILLFLNPQRYQNTFKDPTIVIVKIVEQHRGHLPVNSAHGWVLIPSNCDLRCWQKDISLDIFASPVTVYGCSKEIPCAAVILLNVIADVSTWPEWDVMAQDQTVHLELPENASLHADAYMQCDQVLTSKQNTKPELELFRFGNLESNGTGWILLWSAKRLDWTLYVAQPIDSDSGDGEKAEKCLLTAMWGCCTGSPDALCRKVLALSEAIAASQRRLRPFASLLPPVSHPHFPTIRSALVDLPRRPCVLLALPQKPPALQGAFALALRPTAGGSFALALCHQPQDEPRTEKRRSRRRHKVRSDSMNASFPKLKARTQPSPGPSPEQETLSGASELHLDIETRRSSSLSAPLRKNPPELTVTQAEESVPRVPQRASSHSLLNVIFPRRHSSDGACQRRSRSPSPANRKRRFFHKTSSLSSQEDSYHEPDLSDAQEIDRDFLKMAQSVQDENTDFKALGEYSISAVLQENLRASQVDLDASEEEQKKLSGGWVFKEVNKNIAIFKKTTSLDSCVFMSYLCRGVIPSPLNTVWKTLCNPLTRFMYDDTVKKITVLNEYPSGQKLIHMYNESVTLLHKEVQDFCILQTEKVQGSQFILGFHSVKDIVCPPVKDIIRGTVVASGWVVVPIQYDTNSCQVSYLVQMIVSGPDTSTMEEISNMQSQCIHNLSIYLSAKPPSYLPVHC